MTNENTSPDLDTAVPEKTPESPSRRSFIKNAAVGGVGALATKRAAVGGAAALATGMGAYGVGRASLEGTINKNWPENILADDFKSFDQRNSMWCYAFSPLLAQQWPERNAQFGRLVKSNPKHNWAVRVPFFETKPHDNSRPGFTQLDKALTHSGWFPPMKEELRLSALGMPNTKFSGWDQSDVAAEQYQFASRKEASDAIRSAVRLYGAVRCGIAKRDKRWDYDPIYKLNMSGEQMAELSATLEPIYKGKKPEEYEKIVGMVQEELVHDMPHLVKQMGLTQETLSWEKDFPFEPKTVIVMAVPMDYDCMATAPSLTTGATVGDGYTKMMTLSNAVAKFLRELGYQAVASGNCLGLSVAYGIAAGLGEGGRNNQLLVPGYGPRVRLCKVYTDFEFVDYDGPRDWGITEFCKSCKKCGEACPSGAIDMSDDTSYRFAGEFADEPDYAWSNHEGVKKFHTDAKKCFTYWMDSDTDCGSCAAACTFNEPDFWHHWFIMAINPFMPKGIHSAMAELHPAFGYGGQTGTPQPQKLKKFWKSGEGMRINPTNRNVFGAVGKA